MLVATVPFAVASECVHDYSGEHYCLGYYCGNCDSYCGEANPNGHYWIGEQCTICYETHVHTGNAGTTCLGTLCELCGYPYGEVTDPDEPSDTECDHLCHKDGFLGFIRKIINFFNRLFNINQICDCGKPHYDAPYFG